MSTLRLFFAVLALLATAAAAAEIRITPQVSGVNVRMRGISAVSADVAWASGREGTVLRTVDGGEHWQVLKVPEATELDFRDVEGFDADTAVVLSIGPGDDSRIYRTDDGGQSWQMAFMNQDPDGFLDCMVFDGELGWVMGDPVAGRYQILASSDAGRNWALIDTDMPQALKDEAAFAASGTCIARAHTGQLLIVSGGSSARLFVSGDTATAGWTVHDTGLPSRRPAGGIFSATPVGADGLLLVGGDFEQETSAGSAARVELTVEGVQHITLLASPRGYRSGAACGGAGQLQCVVVGPSGVDALKGDAWQAISDIGYDAVDITGKAGWASGNDGRIARIEIIE